MAFDEVSVGFFAVVLITPKGFLIAVAVADLDINLYVVIAEVLVDLAIG